jgi:arginine decarboxylase
MGLLMPLSTGGRGLLLGARIPKDFFVVKGFGETDAGGGADPYETGSYDLALEDAGIENFNIVPYTSVMPAESTEISVTEARRLFHHGSVLEVIMAKMNGTLGDRISAGVARMQVRRKKDGLHIGGFAAEYEGHASAEVMCDILKSDLQNIFDRRYNSDEYEIFDTQFTTRTAEITKGFGTVLASICFITYLQPIYEQGRGGEADGQPAQPLHIEDTRRSKR